MHFDRIALLDFFAVAFFKFDVFETGIFLNHLLVLLVIRLKVFQNHTCPDKQEGRHNRETKPELRFHLSVPFWKQGSIYKCHFAYLTLIAKGISRWTVSLRLTKKKLCVFTRI